MQDVIGEVVYGVSYDFSDPGAYHYICGLEVATDARVPDGQTMVVLPVGDYAVYVHNGHVDWLLPLIEVVLAADAGKQIGHGPYFEAYHPATFDGMAAAGRVELWFPLNPE